MLGWSCQRTYEPALSALPGASGFSGPHSIPSHPRSLTSRYLSMRHATATNTCPITLSPTKATFLPSMRVSTSCASPNWKS